jgi:Carboxypeptidase regulatory-like domain
MPYFPRDSVTSVSPCLSLSVPFVTSVAKWPKVAGVFLAVWVVFASDPSAQVIIEAAPGQAPPPPPPPPIQMPRMPARDRGPEATGTAQLRGRVTAADNGTPLRKVQIRLSASELHTPRMATTDAEGRYEFRDLPAGRYSVTATKPGFVSLQYGQRRPLEQGRPIELADKQIAEKIDLRLPRGGVLTGRIVDEFNDPVSDATVSVMQLRYMGGRRRPVPVSRPSQTNDLGQFRVWGLPPGEYLVSATLRSFGVDPQMIMGASQDATGYAPTFYPGTANVAEAQRVTVTLGAEASGVEFALLPVRTAKITGIVVDAEGRPFTDGNVMMIQTAGMSGGEGMMFMAGPGGGGRLGADGAFTISSVTPGEYTLQARVRRGKGGSAPAVDFVMPGEGETGTVNVTVTGDDVAGLVIVASKGGKMTGHVTFEGAAPSSSRTENLRVFAQPSGGEFMPMFGGMPGRIGNDGKFELTNLTGRRNIRVRGAQGWFVKSVRVDGRDITDSGIEFKGTEELSGVEIVLTTQMAQIAGTVRGDDGKPAKDYAVVVFPVDKERWTPDSRYFGQARPDQDGRFKVAGLPDETYLVAALEYVDGNDWRDPEFLDRLRDSATRVTAANGELKELELKIISVP